MSQITIYHNPKCSNSRGALEIIRAAGIEPEVIAYLDTPPDRATLQKLIDGQGEGALALVRTKEAIFKELGLDQPDVNDDRLIDAMLAHPILINRPIVVSPKGIKLCRPPELVNTLLP